MKRAAAVLVASPALAAFALLGGANAAQAGEGHHGQGSHHGQEQKPGKHHGHKDCVCTPKPHKPGHVSCKPNCAGHGPKPCPPPKPPVGHHPHKPHHPKPPHHGHHHPPVKPPVTPPVVHPHPPVITPPVTHKPTPTITHAPAAPKPHPHTTSHVDGHKAPPTAELAFTGTPGWVAPALGGGVGFIILGGVLYRLTTPERRFNRATKR